MKKQTINAIVLFVCSIIDQRQIKNKNLKYLIFSGKEGGVLLKMCYVVENLLLW